MTQGPFDNDNNQFVVSYELLQLFRWLLENEQDTLKKLIARSLQNGLNERLCSSQSCEPEIQEDLQQSIVDFFAVFDTLLYDAVNESEVKRVLQRNMIPAIDHIDSTMCDNSVLALSIAKATSTCENNPSEDPKDILCKELLKRWKPAKRIVTN